MKFQKAERKKAKLRLGVAGPSGSGKTFGALKIAEGLGGKIAMIDTEHGSGELYSTLCNYDIATLDPPFTPDRYIALLHDAEEAGYASVILDSISHCWAGVGGLLEIHDKITKTSGNSFAAWREVTPKHNAFVDAMLTSPCHVIACMRSKQEYSLIEDEKGKTRVKKLGLAPVQREGMEYEFTTFLEINIDHLTIATKDRTRVFDGLTPFMIETATGKRFADWLDGGIEVVPPTVESAAKLGEMLEHLAVIENIPHLKNWWAKIQEELQTLTAPDVRLLIEAKDKHKILLDEKGITSK
jgi:hypothetical protein